MPHFLSFSKQWILIPLFLCFSGLAFSQEHHWFQKRSFGEYLYADHYAPIVRVDFGFSSNSEDYNINPERDEDDYILTNETIIGAEIPFFNHTNNNFSISVSVPISFSVWFDFKEETTAPILNTDYRFGIGELNMNYNLRDRSIAKIGLKNIGLKLIPIQHESTHIGDELTIDRIEEEMPITRINVSYETIELAIITNDPFKQAINNSSFKLGARFLIHRKSGWYQIRSIEGDQSIVLSSNQTVEPYFQFQYQQSEGFLSYPWGLFIFSLDITSRICYNYPYYETPEDLYVPLNHDDNRQLSYNAIIGYQLKKKKTTRSDVGFFLRYYNGVNYHGQFRNIPDYEFIGGSLVYTP